MSSWYTAISGVNAATVNLDTTAHNIANASTTGFKNSRAEFGDLVAGKNGIGVQTQAVNQLFQQGNITSTGNDGSDGKLDLAIQGNGLFAVKNVVGGASVDPPIYTRAGSFHIDKDGYVVNNLNQRLQDATGNDIKAPAAGDKIASTTDTGIITFNDTASTTATIGLFDFPNSQGLKAISDTEWNATTASGAAVAVGSPVIRSGFLENSNVDLTNQLVNMIIAQRDYTANAKVITTNDAITQVTINISR